MSSIINGSNTASYYVTPTGVTISGRIKSYSTIAERDAESSPPTYGVVIDATSDPTVKSGSAIYAYRDTGWVKVYETESMDLDDEFNWDNIIGRPDITKEEYDWLVAQVTALGDVTDLNTAFDSMKWVVS